MNEPDAQTLAETRPSNWVDPSTARATAPGGYRAEIVRRGSAPYSDETRVLLRTRLRAASLLLLGLHSAFSVTYFFLQDRTAQSLTQTLVMFVVWASLAAVLFTFPDLSKRALRTIEVIVVAAATASVALSDYAQLVRLSDTLEPGPAGSLVPLLNRLAFGNSVALLLPYIWLMMLYGMLFPARWKRAFLVLLPVALCPLAIRTVFPVWHPDATAGLSTGDFLLTSALLALVFASAVYGTFVISSLRLQALRARRLGQYELVEQIGSGGMGEVWRARHQMLARPAAIKLIRADRLESQSPDETLSTLQRFEREAQATARLNSPHSIVLYDFGITADETFYYVMELLEGIDLGRLVEQFGPVPQARARHLLLQACESLSDAHRSGLVHRDVKPANIFTCRLGALCDFVKVLDFGIAKTIQQTPGDSARVTRAGTLLGTPAFIAPEQAMGEAVDHRADLYSLACVGYWLVTGRYVFEGDNAVSVIADHIRTEPVPASEVAGLPVSKELDELLLRCLAKYPDDRPQSADELADALTRCQNVGAWGQAEARQWWAAHMNTAALVSIGPRPRSSVKP